MLKLVAVSESRISSEEYREAMASSAPGQYVGQGLAIIRGGESTPATVNVPIMETRDMEEGTVHKFKRGPRDIAVGTSIGFPQALYDRGLLRPAAVNLAATYVTAFAFIEEKIQHSYSRPRLFPATVEPEYWTSEYKLSPAASLPYRAAATIALSGFNLNPEAINLPDGASHAPHLASLANPLSYLECRELLSVLK